MRGRAPGQVRHRLRVRGPDSGFATAEAAVVLPVLTLFAMGLLWGLMAAAAQIQCVDAARTGARAAARQDPYGTVLAQARRAAPPGAHVTVRRDGDLVRVRVDAAAPGPAALALHLHQEAAALAEDTVGPESGDGTPARTASGTRNGSTPSGTAPGAGAGSMFGTRPGAGQGSTPGIVRGANTPGTGLGAKPGAGGGSERGVVHGVGGGSGVSGP